MYRREKRELRVRGGNSGIKRRLSRVDLSQNQRKASCSCSAKPQMRDEGRELSLTESGKSSRDPLGEDSSSPNLSSNSHDFCGFALQSLLAMRW